MAELEALLANAASSESHDLTDEAIALIAARIYRARRRRARHIPAELLGEPGWDILLDLFVAKVRGKRVRTISACLAAGAAGTTGLRWLMLLESHGMVERRGDPADRRAKLVQLTDAGYRAMKAYLVEGIEASELPTGRYV